MPGYYLYFASDTGSFKRIFCLLQMLMSVQKIFICVKMDSVWISLVPTVANVRWDSLPPRTANHAKVSHWYFKFIFWVWIGCNKANKKFWRDLSLEAEYSARASPVSNFFKRRLFCSINYIEGGFHLFIKFSWPWSKNPTVELWLSNFVLLIFPCLFVTSEECVESRVCHCLFCMFTYETETASSDLILKEMFSGKFK